MQYISKLFALNLPCSLDTPGDWHSTSLNWKKASILDAEDSIYGKYGIETPKINPYNSALSKYPVANHIRAILDILESGEVGKAYDAEVYLSNPEYHEELFQKVMCLYGVNHWEKIDRLMRDEFQAEWVRYKMNALDKGVIQHDRIKKLANQT